MNNAESVLTIYSRPDCHLCEEMLEALQKWQSRFNFRVNIVDIDEDLSLTARFAARIPVLAAGDIEICGYHLDEKALLAFFEGQN